MGPTGLFSKRDVSSISYDAVRPLVKWTYTWMIVGLLMTAAVSYATLNTPGLMESIFNSGLIFVALIGEFVLVIALSWAIARLSPMVAAIMFLVYAALNGLVLSVIGVAYTGESIALAFVSTAAVFGVMTVFAFTTSIDLLQYRSYLMIGLIGLFVAMIINMFANSGPFEMLISLAGVLIFTGLTAYDTQKLKYMAASPQFAEDGEAVGRWSILGALQLYLDFINLFLFIVMLTGRRR